MSHLYRQDLRHQDRILSSSLETSPLEFNSKTIIHTYIFTIYHGGFLRVQTLWSIRYLEQNRCPISNAIKTIFGNQFRKKKIPPQNYKDSAFLTNWWRLHRHFVIDLFYNPIFSRLHKSPAATN